MFNLTRMELRRLTKQKSTYIILLSVVLILTMFMFLWDFSIKILEENMQTMQNQSLPEQINSELTETEDGNTDDKITNAANHNQNIDFQFNAGDGSFDLGTGEDLLLEQFTGRGILIFIIIFAAMFFTAPYRNGYVKNFLGMKRNRTGFIFAQFIVGISYSIVIFIVATATLSIGINMVFSEKFKIVNWGNLFEIIGFHLVFHIAFLAIILFLATLTRHLSAVLVSGLLYVTVFNKMIWGLLTDLLKKIFDFSGEWALSNYTVIGNIDSINMNSGNTDLIRATIVCMVLMVLALGGSCLVLQRKDVN